MSATDGGAAPPLTVVVADDDPRARRYLVAMLDELDGVEVVAEAADGAETYAASARVHPDVVLLDVEMPVQSGTDVAARLAAIDPPPVVIFTTAFERYAMRAFEVSATDYLLKPFGRGRLESALERARSHVAARRALAEVAKRTTVQEGAHAVVTPAHLLVRQARGLVPVPLREIVRLEADDDYVRVHAVTGRHLITARLRDVARTLDPARFVRVHRSHVVNLEHVERLVAHDARRFEVVLKDGTRVLASRAHSQSLRRLARHRAEGVVNARAASRGS